MGRFWVAWLGILWLLAPAWASAQETRLEAVGGNGGAPFASICPANARLVGLEVRAGDYIDAVRALCQRNYQTPPEPIGGFAGGLGGVPRLFACPSRLNQRFPDWRQPITGADWTARGRDLVIVRDLALYCGDNPFSRPPDASYVGAQVDVPLFAPFGTEIKRRQVCPAGTQAVGVHGRAGDFVDAIGLVCARRAIPGFGRPPAHPCTLAKRAQGRVPAPEYDRLIDTCLAAFPDPGGQTSNPCVQAKRTRGRAAFNGNFQRCLATFPD